MSKDASKKLYVCNRKRCRNCYSACNLTSDVRFAAIDDTVVIADGIAMEWIPVEENLPEKGEAVLVTDTNGYIRHCYRNGTTKYDFATCEEGMHISCVAWMPLPEPYKEGTDYDVDRDYNIEWEVETEPAELDDTITEPNQDQRRAKEPATAFYIDVPAFRKLPKTIKDPRIKPDMGVTARLSNPLAQVGNWIAETEEGFLVLSGCIRGTTAARLKVGYGVGGLWELLSEDF